MQISVCLPPFPSLPRALLLRGLEEPGAQWQRCVWGCWWDQGDAPVSVCRGTSPPAIPCRGHGQREGFPPPSCLPLRQRAENWVRHSLLLLVGEGRGLHCSFPQTTGPCLGEGGKGLHGLPQPHPIPQGISELQELASGLAKCHGSHPCILLTSGSMDPTLRALPASRGEGASTWAVSSQGLS